MAHNRDYKPEDIAFPDQHITESELVREMQTSYIDYAMSVIVGRALPDVRDGLKPVHRRILYSMYEAGLTHSNPYKTLHDALPISQRGFLWIFMPGASQTCTPISSISVPIRSPISCMSLTSKDCASNVPTGIALQN